MPGINQRQTKNNLKMSHTSIIKLMKKSILLFLSFLIFACSKPAITPEPVIPPVTGNPDPEQYGIPYTGVPAAQDAAIYQVNMRAFSAGGNFAGVTARLDSIKALGVNVVYLMPVYPVGVLKSVNSPYCVKDYKGINAEFGSLGDLRTLIDGAHSRNMSVILDWVANHTSWDNEWINSNKSWYLQDAGGNVLSPPGTGWNDVAQLNFTNNDMRLAMIKAMKYWVFTANIDGFRCDYADGPPVDFWKQAIDTLRNISTHKLLMLAEGTRSANFSAGFDFNFGFSFFGGLKNIYANGQSVLAIDGLNTTEYNGAATGKQVVRYITNHDVNGSDGTPLELFGGDMGSMAAFAVVAFMKSVPMIYNGQEVGNTTRITFPFTTTKVNWTGNYSMEADYKKLIAFRNSSIAVRGGTLTSYTTADVCAFTKIQGTEKVLIISNLRNSTISYSIPLMYQNTSWQDVMNGGNLALTTQVSLPPYTYFILKN